MYVAQLFIYLMCSAYQLHVMWLACAVCVVSIPVEERESPKYATGLVTQIFCKLFLYSLSLYLSVDWYCGNHIPGYFLFSSSHSHSFSSFHICTQKLRNCYGWHSSLYPVPPHREQRLFQMAFLGLTSRVVCWCIETITGVAFLNIPLLTHPVIFWNLEISICLSDDPRLTLQATQQRASAQSLQTQYISKSAFLETFRIMKLKDINKT